MAFYVAGYGLVTDDELAIRNICRKHDHDLVFKRSQRTNQFTIFQRLMRDNVYVQRWEEADLEEGDLFPVCSFAGRLPSVDEVDKWLYQHDASRKDILAEVTKRNQKRMQEADKHTREAGHEAALRLERLAHGMTISAPNDGKRRR